jgi:N-acetylmuramoyl-L-alanine amidase
MFRLPALVSLAASLALASLYTVCPGTTAWGAGDIAGTAVFLDPGHNGANDSSITKQVPDGRGGTKDCQTTGAATADGYPEHSFNWQVAQQVRDALTRMGVRIQMSRDNDTGLGPCVDQRAATPMRCAPTQWSASTPTAGRRLVGGFT